MTGNEIINGDIADTNAQLLAKTFSQWGVNLCEKVTVGDDINAIACAIKRLKNQFDIVFINGGLGPTSDDLTTQAMAEALGEGLQLHPDAKQHVSAWCHKRNIALSDSNLKQALLPQSCQIISQSPGSACAFYSHNQALIIATPGVPSELTHILNHAIKPLFEQNFHLSAAQTTDYYQIFGIGESDLQALINQQFSDIEAHYQLGFRAADGKIEFKITTNHASADPSFKQKLLETLKPFIFHHGKGNLNEVVLALCQQQHLKLAFAESCTGGLLAHRISQTAGASEVLQGGIVSYSNQAKRQLLGVSEQVLIEHGAVSEPTAIAMLQGATNAFNADIAASVTGIAGPGGGSVEKPVGTVWVAIGNTENYTTYGLCLPLERSQFQQRISQVIFDLIRRRLLGLEPWPEYLRRYQR